jgi:hypothetical protein
MMVPDPVLDRMYSSGYCDETISHAASTPYPGEAGQKARLLSLRDHLPTCADCERAVKFKSVEAEIAKRLDSANGGTAAMDAFKSGDGLEIQPGHKPVMAAVLKEAIDRRFISLEDLTWAKSKSKRFSQPWPGRK